MKTENRRWLMKPPIHLNPHRKFHSGSGGWIERQRQSTWKTEMLKHTALALLVIFAFARSSLADDGDVRTVKDLLEKVQSLEQAVRITEVPHFKGRALMTDADGAFKPTPRVVEGSVTYDSVLGGRFVARLT